jgi:hypothetical protein
LSRLTSHSCLTTPLTTNKRGARRVRQNKSSGSQRLTERDARANHIPQFASTVSVRHHFRYQASGVLSNKSITRGSLLNLLVSGAFQLTNQLNRLFSAVKLNKVEARCPTGGSDVALNTLSIEWFSTLGPTSEVSDTGTPLHPPILVTSPPRQSLAGFWSLTGTSESDVLFQINGPTGTIVDIWIEATLQDGESPTVIVPTNAPSNGALYALALDGISSNVLAPVSYTTIS